VGSYAITGGGLAANNGNYVFAQAAGNGNAFAISPATLTYVANQASSTYGATIPTLTGTVTGFVNNDTLASAATGTLSFSTTATSSSNVGSYAITGSGLTASSNYVFAQAAGNGNAFAITPATLTYVANPASSTFGAPIPALTGTVTGFVNNDTLASATTGALGFSTTATSIANSGSYAITGGGLTANNGNYVFIQAAGNTSALTITPANNNVTTPPAATANYGIQQVASLTQPAVFTPVLNQPVITPIALGTPPGGGIGSTGTGSIGNSAVPTLPGIAPLPPPPTITRGVGIPPPGETRYLAQEVVLELGVDVSSQRLQEVARQLGLTIVLSERFDALGRAAYRFTFSEGRNVTQIIRALEANGIVAGAQPNYVYQVTQDRASQVAAPAASADSSLQSVPSDPKPHTPPPAGDPAQYVIPKLQLDNVHGITQGNDVLVALIDSEIDRGHPDLKDAVVERYDAGCGAERPDSHGTGMAGAIGSRRLLRGVAPRTRILAICAFGGKAASAESTTMQIIRGIDYAVSRGARIINMSFAGPHDPMLERALRTAHDKGAILIAAAGNAGPKSPPLYPGADPAVIAVTATDIADRVFAGANRGKYIMVAAPGVDVMVPSPDNQYTLTTGTSVAAANVSGVAALLMEGRPNLEPETLRYLLVSTAKALNARSREEVGSGLVDPVRAIAAKPPEVSSPEVTSSVAQPRTSAARGFPRLWR